MRYGYFDDAGREYVIDDVTCPQPLTNYLGTIANLATPIVKNPSQTLKVTYTLTDA